MNSGQRRALAGLAFVALAIVSAPAGAQSLQAVRACTTEADAALRLRCYDRAAGRPDAAAAAAAATTPAPASPAPASSAAPTSAGAAASAPTPAAAPEFGVAGGPLSAKKQAAATHQITASVTAIQTKPHGELVITLDNGEVWAQLEPVAYFPLNVGDSVQIRAATLGSYLLFTPAKRSTKVTRLR